MNTRFLIAATALAATAAILAGIATAGPAAKARPQRVAILLHKTTFTLVPLASGSVKGDSGTDQACCWTSRAVTRDGQSAEIDNPTLTFKGKNGTFTWHEKITFVDIDNDYTVGTGVWRISGGTGAYAHLEGHGREAFVNRTAENRTVADRAEGVVDVGR